jgi:MHS family proline/betaine transporter-like MFS transporter
MPDSNGRPAGTRRALVVGALGTIIEWYDFSLYVFLAPVYARVFFPNEEGLDGVVITLALFAVAYLARPVGAIVFGHFGDRIGRRGALLASASIMSVALLLNGLLPSEASVGCSRRWASSSCGWRWASRSAASTPASSSTC